MGDDANNLNWENIDVKPETIDPNERSVPFRKRVAIEARMRRENVPAKILRGNLSVLDAGDDANVSNFGSSTDESINLGTNIPPVWIKPEKADASESTQGKTRPHSKLRLDGSSRVR